MNKLNYYSSNWHSSKWYQIRYQMIPNRIPSIIITSFTNSSPHAPWNSNKTQEHFQPNSNPPPKKKSAGAPIYPFLNLRLAAVSGTWSHVTGRCSREKWCLSSAFQATSEVYMVCINGLNWFKTFEHTISHQVRTVFSSLSVSGQVEVPSNSCKMLQTSLQLVYFKLLGA
jgi:hypothetical protein